MNEITREIHNCLEQVLREKFEHQGPVAPDMRLIADLNFDSLQLFELITEVEERYHVSIPADRLSGINTLGDVASLVASLKTEGNNSTPAPG